MEKNSKRKLLIANVCYWLAAILIPPLLHALPASHPPRILPLFIYVFLIALAIGSTSMWNKAIPVGSESHADNV